MGLRKVFEGNVFVLCTGCQWKALPKKEFGSAGFIHQYFLEWKRKVVFLRLWRKGLAGYDKMEGIAWSWQSIDGAADPQHVSFGGRGSNPADGGKMGPRELFLSTALESPLSLLVSGAQQHYVKLLEPTLENIVIERRSGKGSRQGLG
jgi:putative transposase